MEIEDAGDTLVQTGPSVEDTSELKALVGQLSKTLEFLNMQEEQKRERQSTQQEDRDNGQLVEDLKKNQKKYI